MGKITVFSNLLLVQKATHLRLFHKHVPIAHYVTTTVIVPGTFSTPNGTATQRSCATLMCHDCSQYSCFSVSVQSRSSSTNAWIWKCNLRWPDAFQKQNVCGHMRMLSQHSCLHSTVLRQGVMKTLPSPIRVVTRRNLHYFSRFTKDSQNMSNFVDAVHERNYNHMFPMNAAKLRECSTTSLCGSHMTSQLYGHRHHLHTLCQTLLQPSKNRFTGFSSSMLLHTVAEYSLENSDYSDYLDSLLDEFTALTEAKLKGENIDYSHFMFLEAVAMTMQELRTEYAELADLRSMLSGEVDKELETMAETDIDNLTQHIQTLEEKLVDILVGPEPADKNDTMLEVSAGVGGQEAMLFTTEIFDMYSGYAYFKGWAFDLVDYEKSEMGGLRRASALISGTNVYKHLKFEAGVHRVQRVPKTERSGRVHTSTMTVAVLPQPSQIDISINPKDLNIDTFRSSGAGGQHVNTTESAVRITHKPSGTVAECQQERSQIKNREKAMKILLSRIYQKQVEDQETALRKKRKLQVGSAGRSEKIRTYNYSQDRITDHRGPITFYNVPQFLSGEDSMEDLLQTLMTQSRLQILQAMVDQFVDSQRRKK